MTPQDYQLFRDDLPPIVSTTHIQPTREQALAFAYDLFDSSTPVAYLIQDLLDFVYGKPTQHLGTNLDVIA